MVLQHSKSVWSIFDILNKIGALSFRKTIMPSSYSYDFETEKAFLLPRELLCFNWLSKATSKNKQSSRELGLSEVPPTLNEDEALKPLLLNI